MGKKPARPNSMNSKSRGAEAECRSSSSWSSGVSSRFAIRRSEVFRISTRIRINVVVMMMMMIVVTTTVLLLIVIIVPNTLNPKPRTFARHLNPTGKPKSRKSPPGPQKSPAEDARFGLEFRVWLLGCGQPKKLYNS